MADNNPFDELKCVASYELMTDAVIGTCGHCHSEKLLNKMFSERDAGSYVNCFICRSLIYKVDLRPVYAVRNAALTFKELGITEPDMTSQAIFSGELPKAIEKMKQEKLKAEIAEHKTAMMECKTTELIKADQNKINSLQCEITQLSNEIYDLKIQLAEVKRKTKVRNDTDELWKQNSKHTDVISNVYTGDTYDTYKKYKNDKIIHVFKNDIYNIIDYDTDYKIKKKIHNYF